MTDLTHIAARPRHVPGRPARSRLRRWMHNHRTRAALARLTPERLADIGLSPAAARREARKWFWQD